MRTLPTRLVPTRSLLGAASSALLVATLAACGNPSGPNGDRSLGILQLEVGPSGPETTGSAVDPIRWSVPPDESVAFPPEVLSAPDTVVVDEPFVVTAFTMGPNGCWGADGIDVAVEGRMVELTPWDRNSGAEVCTMIFGYLAHPATVTLDRLGEWTLRVVGRRVRGDGSLDVSVSADRNVFVREPYTSEEPFEVTIPRGNTIQVDGLFGLTFAEVTGDSRCPAGVMCVWEGDATVLIGLRIGMGPTEAFTLHTSLEPRSVEYAGYRVTLAGLEPYPMVGLPSLQDDYRARFGIERLP